MILVMLIFGILTSVIDIYVDDGPSNELELNSGLVYAYGYTNRKQTRIYT
jgi:hypothetical protein